MFRRKQAETGGDNNRSVIQCVAENRPAEPALNRRSRQRQAETGEKKQLKGGVKAETGRNRRKGRAEKIIVDAQTAERISANYVVKAETGGNRRKQTICLLLNALAERISTRSRVKAETGRNRRKHRQTQTTVSNSQLDSMRAFSRQRVRMLAHKKSGERTKTVRGCWVLAGGCE